MTVVQVVACPKCGVELSGWINPSSVSTLKMEQPKLDRTCTWAVDDLEAKDCPHLQEEWRRVQGEAKEYLK